MGGDGGLWRELTAKKMASGSPRGAEEAAAGLDLIIRAVGIGYKAALKDISFGWRVEITLCFC